MHLKDHFKNLDPLKKDILCTFFRSEIQEQRKIIHDRSMDVFYAMKEVLEKVSHDKTIMLLLTTTLDGVLQDDNRNAKQNFIQFNKENLGFLESLAQLLYVEQDLEVHESVLKISSFIVSTNSDLNIQKGFLKNLMKEYNEKKLRISDYCYFGCLT